MAGLLGSVGEAAAGAGAAIGDMASSAGSALGSAGSSIGDALGSMGSAVEPGGASGAVSGLMDNASSIFGNLQKLQGSSNNNPNSGMVGSSQAQQDPMMSQMMQQAMQQSSQQKPYKKVEFDPLPWQNQAGDIVKRREGQTGQVNLSGLLGMLTNGSLPMHSINDTGGSGAGGTSGGLVKGILSKL
jgi:hypothetical protein